jgi:hypothetical protein
MPSRKATTRYKFYRTIKGSKVYELVNLGRNAKAFKEKMKKYKTLIGENKIAGKEISLRPYEVVVGQIK